MVCRLSIFFFYFFYFKFWHIVGHDVTMAVLSFLRSGRYLQKMNFTHIVLIPKKNEPKYITDFCPISLGNIVSRIISKVLANRIKCILPNVIFDSQSAFVPNRSIIDNITVAYEMLHRMRNRRKGKTWHMVVKLDISKAYDRVEWEFLQRIMLKIGIPTQWVRLPMETVRTTSYSILINGEPTGFITPSRGIKQGDPLSPYLFLLCAEGLSPLIRKAIENHHLKGVVSCNGGVKISHLLFANDSLLFCETTTRECKHLLDILALYEGASGQAINRQKTTLFFNPNTNQGVKLAIQNMLGVQIMTNCERYLGLPMVGEKSKVSTFREIQEWVTKRVIGWKEKHISKAGREVLIKTVIQAIPTYSMSMFKFSKKICDDIDLVLLQYWGGRLKMKEKSIESSHAS